MIQKNRSKLEDWAISAILSEKKKEFFCLFFRATPIAYGGSQARGLKGATTVSLCHSHNNAGSEPCPQPTLSYRAMSDR